MPKAARINIQKPTTNQIFMSIWRGLLIVTERRRSITWRFSSVAQRIETDTRWENRAQDSAALLLDTQGWCSVSNDKDTNPNECLSLRVWGRQQCPPPSHVRYDMYCVFHWNTKSSFCSKECVMVIHTKQTTWGCGASAGWSPPWEALSERTLPRIDGRRGRCLFPHLHPPPNILGSSAACGRWHTCPCVCSLTWK